MIRICCVVYTARPKLERITRFNIKSIVAFEYVQRVPAWMDVDDGEVGGYL